MALSTVVSKINKLNSIAGSPLIIEDKINDKSARDLYFFIDEMLSETRVLARQNTCREGFTNHLIKSSSSLASMGFPIPESCINILNVAVAA